MPPPKRKSTKSGSRKRTKEEVAEEDVEEEEHSQRSDKSSSAEVSNNSDSRPQQIPSATTTIENISSESLSPHERLKQLAFRSLKRSQDMFVYSYGARSQENFERFEGKGKKK